MRTWRCRRGVAGSALVVLARSATAVALAELPDPPPAFEYAADPVTANSSVVAGIGY
jgi:hypothetical protein